MYFIGDELSSSKVTGLYCTRCRADMCNRYSSQNLLLNLEHWSCSGSESIALGNVEIARYRPVAGLPSIFMNTYWADMSIWHIYMYHYTTNTVICLNSSGIRPLMLQVGNLTYFVPIFQSVTRPMCHHRPHTSRNPIFHSSLKAHAYI